MLLDLFFPLRCIGCGLYDTSLCDPCVMAHLDIALSRLADLDVDQIITLGAYADPFWRASIEQLKFRGVTSIGKTLSLWATRAVHATIPIDSDTVITSIPLHWRRQRQRGYNQAELIAQPLAIKMGLGHTSLIKRTRATKPQSRRKHHKRWKNVAGAFTCTQQTFVRPSRIVLVDDVITTGSTTRAAVDALRQHYTCPISIVAIARSAQLTTVTRVPATLF